MVVGGYCVYVVLCVVVVVLMLGCVGVVVVFCGVCVVWYGDVLMFGVLCGV